MPHTFNMFLSICFLLHELTGILLDQAIVDYCPSLLRGSEMKLCATLKKNEQISHEIIEALAKAGSQISIRLRYLLLYT